MIGTTLDKYEVLQKVGEGGMATVYRGRHSTLDRDVAIKVLHPHLSSSSRNRLRFAREAKAVERLRHRNILEIFDYSGSEADDCYIVTEFVEGETLTQLLHRTGRMPSEVVAMVGADVARALAYAHREGILHRDLKTDNVMMRVDGAVKLMDFGIARFLDESQVTMTGALVGSPAFMSPEQAQEFVLDARSDLFSLGTVLYYLVTGHLPFSGSNPSLILKNVIEGNRPHVTELAPTMSASLADVVERLLATSPNDRFNTAYDVEDALLTCVRETGVDPADAVWSVRAFRDAPEAYVERLDAHLTTVLANEGRRHLAEGDHLAALRLFNRLLSMDEDNAEVLALVQNLHGAPTANAGPSMRWVGVVGALILVGFGVWVTSPSKPPEVSAPVSEPRDASVAAFVESEVGEAGRDPTGLVEPVADVSERPAAPTVGPAAEAVRPVVERAPVRRRTRAAARLSPEETPSVTAPAAMGRLWVNADNHDAEVWIGNQQVGRTREWIALPAGAYDLTVKSPYVLDHIESAVAVSSEADSRVRVSLALKPRNVELVGWPVDCTVYVDGDVRGSVAALGERLTVEQPDRGLNLVVVCPDGTRAERHWPHLLADERVVAPDGPG